MTAKFKDTWLSESFYERLLQFYSAETREKSEQLLSSNLVQEVYIEPGRISSKINIDKRTSQRIVLHVPEVSAADFERIISTLSKNEGCLVGLYNNKLTDICFEDEFIRNVLLFDIKNARAVLDDQNISLEDERVLAVFEKCINFLIENSLSYIALRGMGTEQFIHDIREARISYLLSSKSLAEKITPTSHISKLVVPAERYYCGMEVHEMDLVVRADELPAALLKRLDHLPSYEGLEFLDKNLEMAYERITRLAQSLARFLN